MASSDRRFRTDEADWSEKKEIPKAVPARPQSPSGFGSRDEWVRAGGPCERLRIRQRVCRAAGGVRHAGGCGCGYRGSTSGNSLNVLGGIQAAHKAGMLMVAFTGKVGGKASKVATLSLRVPSDVAARIQERHMLAGHMLNGCCEHLLCAGPRAVSR